MFGFINEEICIAPMHRLFRVPVNFGAEPMDLRFVKTTSTLLPTNQYPPLGKTFSLLLHERKATNDCLSLPAVTCSPFFLINSRRFGKVRSSTTHTTYSNCRLKDKNIFLHLLQFLSGKASLVLTHNVALPRQAQPMPELSNYPMLTSHTPNPCQSSCTASAEMWCLARQQCSINMLTSLPKPHPFMLLNVIEMQSWVKERLKHRKMGKL